MLMRLEKRGSKYFWPQMYDAYPRSSRNAFSIVDCPTLQHLRDVEKLPSMKLAKKTAEDTSSLSALSL